MLRLLLQQLHPTPAQVSNKYEKANRNFFGLWEWKKTWHMIIISWKF